MATLNRVGVGVTTWIEVDLDQIGERVVSHMNTVAARILDMHIVSFEFCAFALRQPHGCKDMMVQK